MKLLKPKKVNCQTCHGKGWRFTYHDEVEECSRCSSTGKQVVEMPISFEELCLAHEGTKPTSSVDFLKLIHIYQEWREEYGRKRQ